MINQISNNQIDYKLDYNQILALDYRLLSKSVIYPMAYSFRKLCDKIDYKYNHTRKAFYALKIALQGQAKCKLTRLTLCQITSKHVYILHNTIIDITRHDQTIYPLTDAHQTQNLNSDLKQFEDSCVMCYYYDNKRSHKSKQPPQKPIQYRTHYS